MAGCALCLAAATRELSYADGKVVAFADGYPVSDGHTLIVPLRHVAKVADLTAEESYSIADAVRLLCVEGDYTVGINDGPLAGQTVPHLHVHVIPRKSGDVEDPRGGVRWVIPELADYWSDQ